MFLLKISWFRLPTSPRCWLNSTGSVLNTTPIFRFSDTPVKLLRDTYLATAELGGTISGEHGIGHKRKGYMELVMSEAHLDILRNIKLALDPNLVLNPGKIFDM